MLGHGLIEVSFNHNPFIATIQNAFFKNIVTKNQARNE